MEKGRLVVMMMMTVVCLVVQTEAFEMPEYEVVHIAADFEIRLYSESLWIAAPVTQISFETATSEGFYRLFQYIQGGNLNWTRIPMTAPVVTSIVRGAGPFYSSAYSVLFYLPAKFQADPPFPFSALHLKPYLWGTHCVAVRKFPGFAKDDNIIKEATKLANSLGNFSLTNITLAKSRSAYSIAQYDAPFRFVGRVNEVWTEIKASDINGCEYNETATY